MTERLTHMLPMNRHEPATDFLWVKNIEDGRLLRRATAEDRAGLQMETEEEFWRSADALMDRVSARLAGVDGA